MKRLPHSRINLFIINKNFFHTPVSFFVQVAQVVVLTQLGRRCLCPHSVLPPALSWRRQGGVFFLVVAEVAASAASAEAAAGAAAAEVAAGLPLLGGCSRLSKQMARDTTPASH